MDRFSAIMVCVTFCAEYLLWHVGRHLHRRNVALYGHFGKDTFFYNVIASSAAIILIAMGVILISFGMPVFVKAILVG
ncbi:MAG: hypothetical protein EOP83_08085 [Verrucomicrobiaceae bacterium]|nr:MAG: hypothetical protein EOP83_08085 [Verrucomicrobiaceae bacterium]